MTSLAARAACIAMSLSFTAVAQMTSPCALVHVAFVAYTSIVGPIIALERSCVIALYAIRRSFS